MTIEDREVLREVWDGRIPAVFTLAEQDKDEDSPSDPFYLMLPRMSYLPLATDKVKKYFLRDSMDQHNMWFDYKGTPLKWHHPIGALYDVVRGRVLDNDEGLPWQITVHFSAFPQDQLIPLHSREVVESNFMSAVKEADQLKHGGRIVASMQKKDHLQLWTGLQNDKFDQFWAINRRLMETVSGEDNFKHIPIRFHLANNQTVTQKLIKPFSESTNDILTMGELQELTYPSSTFIIQGVSPSADTPVQWLSRHLSYPDNFLHIAVH
eukprot:TRINITY_DN36888_c0_g1_i1.p1 TRINITY_DN36888_c0_g1~~TRINITY_DN36888_c0_g1_i1.p1  ORF type:complete len:266 (-),score=36.32 TRINITY_DN36888_c0_g1_i1:146-943(-)